MTRYHHLALALLSTFLAQPTLAVLEAQAEDLAVQYGLATSTSLAFPSATMSAQDTDNLVVQNWSLGKGRIQDNPQNLQFVADPFPNKPPPLSTVNFTGPVLQVTYPQGSYSHDTGGSQLINLWNTTDGSHFQTMMVTYEVAFDSGFDWVKGGKLPGLRGGTNSSGCSGGNQADGKDCFSTRVMWRKNAQGEIYAYIPPANGLCDQSNVQCNSDFGISISRGSFGFISGEWNRITLLVRLNDPPNVANGQVQLFYNSLQAINQTGLQLRSADSVNINGFYFSTFFGGSDQSWETPTTVHTYFRDIRLWANSSPSNLTGSVVNNAAVATSHSVVGLVSTILLAVVLFF